MVLHSTKAKAGKELCSSSWCDERFLNWEFWLIKNCRTVQRIACTLILGVPVLLFLCYLFSVEKLKFSYRICKDWKNNKLFWFCKVWEGSLEEVKISYLHSLRSRFPRILAPSWSVSWYVNVVSLKTNQRFFQFRLQNVKICKNRQVCWISG